MRQRNVPASIRLDPKRPALTARLFTTRFKDFGAACITATTVQSDRQIGRIGCEGS